MLESVRENGYGHVQHDLDDWPVHLAVKMPLQPGPPYILVRANELSIISRASTIEYGNWINYNPAGFNKTVGH